MGSVTPLHALRYPVGGDNVSLATYYQNLANDTDTQLPIVSTSTPTAKSGIVWYNPTTDLTQIYTGTVWTPVGGSSPWTAFTPVWVGASTNPVIGNGTLSGRYSQIGKHVTAQWYLRPGSTTTFGSGAYSFTLPVASSASQQGSAVGQLYAVNNGNYFTCGALLLGQGGTSVTPWLPASTATTALAQLSPTVPWTIKSTDTFNFTLKYESP